MRAWKCQAVDPAWCVLAPMPMGMAASETLLYLLPQAQSPPLPSSCPVPNAEAENPAKMLEKEKRAAPWGQRNLELRAKVVGGNRAPRAKAVSWTQRP